MIRKTIRPPSTVPQGEADDEPPDPGLLFQPRPQAEQPVQLPLFRPAPSVLKVVSSEKRSPRTSPQTEQFRKRFYHGIPKALWNDWHWQVGNRIRSLAQLKVMLDLSEAETAALSSTNGQQLPAAITPYYMSLISHSDPDQALRRTMIPTLYERMTSPGEADDPLSEDSQSPVPGLVHRYPDRVLLLVHDFCAAYCRYCTRSRVVGRGKLFPARSRLEAALAYIRSKETIRDVVLSGGDPLLLGDDRLNWILDQLRRIPHVEIIRIGTKVPAVLPQRVTPKLVRMLQHYHPLWMSLHFTHPDECTPEAYKACALLADAGIPMGSQTVLLKGINDSVETMKRLVHHLMRMRVRPYYLYQCDPILGSGHFRTPVERGIEIIRGLRGFTSGYAVPTYVIDTPGGGGKIPVSPEYLQGRQGSDLLLRNFEGKGFRYRDPCPDPPLEAEPADGVPEVPVTAVSSMVSVTPCISV